jgi:hypothetical protein
LKLDPDKFKEDESRSNPMVVAMTYPGCPIKGVCFGMAVGFGNPVNECPHLKTDGNTYMECGKEENQSNLGSEV